MRRAYNHKISERANRSLSKRAAQVHMQKCFIMIAFIIIIVLGVLFGTSIHVLASDNKVQEASKYYMSIRIEAGDTLWDIAGEYAQNTDMTRQEYIDEVCRLNGICEDEIYAGEYIVVVYYK